MSSWSSGYVSEITYTHGYYRELNPSLLRFAALVNGVRFPTGRLAYCELGCGQGVSTNLLAASNPDIDFYATDFNPAQINGAKALAAAAKTPNVAFYDTTFEDFADDPSLPAKFDVIAMHGIYSWISADSRRAIIDFIARKLNVGGIVYLSYNTYPGWAAAEPMRQLLYDHVQTSQGPILERLESALKFAEDVASKSAFFTANPIIKARLEDLKTKSRNYLAHEYLNDSFFPFYFRQVASDLAEAKLSFVGSAHVLDHIASINLTADQQNLLAAEKDPIRREGVRDYAVNQQFRKDLFGKGMLPHTANSRQQAWLETRFALSARIEDVSMTINGSLGEAKLQEAVYQPILEAFRAGPATLHEVIAGHKVVAELGWQRVQEAVTVLVGADVLHPCLPAKGETARIKATTAFNAAVMEMAKDAGDITYLASPVTGGALSVSRFRQFFALAQQQGGKTPEDWAKAAWQILAAQGQQLVKEGKTLTAEQENIAELTAQAKEFQDKQLPILKTLRVI